MRECRRGRGASYMCAGATGGLLPTPSEAGDCCLRGKEGGSIGEKKMEMQPTQQHWQLCHMTLRLLSTFTTTWAQTPCQTHNLFFLSECTEVGKEGWEDTCHAWVFVWAVDHPYANHLSIRKWGWVASGLPVMWPHNFMIHHNLIPLSSLASSSAGDPIADVLMEVGKELFSGLIHATHS